MALSLEEAFVKLRINPEQVKPKQNLIIQSLLNGDNVLGILPTGFGKSLCFQAPALVTEGTTLVFSPLISLMKDQINFLQSCGIKAEQWNSTITPAKKKKIKADFEDGKLDLLYMAPEALASTTWQEEIRFPPINYIVIDEVHCLSQWGQDFRPDYLRLYKLIKKLGPIAVLGCSATIDQHDYKYIKKNLVFDKIVSGDMIRPNLHYRVIEDYGSKHSQLYDDIRNRTYKMPLLIFCATIKNVESIYRKLSTMFPGRVGYYHGKRSTRERHEAQDAFLSNDIDIMVATNAFGMGVNKPDIRTIIHADLPISLTHYVQESGRAGRDGKDSDCVIYYPFNGIHRIQKYFIDNKNPDQYSIKKVFDILKEMGPFPVMTQRDLAMMSRVSEYTMPAVLAVLKKYQILDTEHTIRQRVKIVKEEMPETQPMKKVYTLLQNGTHNITTIANELDWDYRELRDYLNDMHHLGYINFKIVDAKATRGTCFKLLQESLGSIDWAELEEKRRQQLSRFQEMVNFSRSTNKRQYIKEYFDNISKV